MAPHADAGCDISLVVPAQSHLLCLRVCPVAFPAACRAALDPAPEATGADAVADRFISPDKCPVTDQVDYFWFARETTRIRTTLSSSRVLWPVGIEKGTKEVIPVNFSVCGQRTFNNLQTTFLLKFPEQEFFNSHA
jgi:hypothetical protein